MLLSLTKYIAHLLLGLLLPQILLTRRMHAINDVGLPDLFFISLPLLLRLPRRPFRLGLLFLLRQLGSLHFLLFLEKVPAEADVSYPFRRLSFLSQPKRARLTAWIEEQGR